MQPKEEVALGPSAAEILQNGTPNATGGIRYEGINYTPQAVQNMKNNLQAPAAEMPAGQNPQEFIQNLIAGVDQFGKQFNIQTIRPYNDAIRQALTSIKSLATLPTLSPEIEQTGNQLLQLFEDIKASDAEDAQLIDQIRQLAQQLAMATKRQPAPSAQQNWLQQQGLLPGRAA
jgi:hypothetical protein